MREEFGAARWSGGSRSGECEEDMWHCAQRQMGAELMSDGEK